MRRFFLGAIVLGVVGVGAAQAGPPDAWHDFWHGVKRDFHRNNCWPDPFVYPDRAALHNTFSLQVQNGWKLQNLMGDYHFDSETQQLTSAGKEKVRWIMTQAPEQFRTVFVQRDADSEKTAIRVDAVQQYAAKLAPKGNLPPVVESNLTPRGWPADEINDVFVKYRTTAKPPQLPDASSDAK
jgi:hypothetical protein